MRPAAEAPPQHPPMRADASTDAHDVMARADTSCDYLGFAI